MIDNALLNRARDAWRTLAPRERQFAIIGAAVLGAVLLYLLVWLPIGQDVARLRVAVPETQAQLGKMRNQSAMIQPLRGRAASVPAPGTLVSVVDQSATGRGLRKQISRLEAEGSNGVQINAEAVSFNALIAWLAELREANALVVDNLSLDAGSAPGMVSAKIRLRVETP
jgi:general secretion pathway protein M